MTGVATKESKRYMVPEILSISESGNGCEFKTLDSVFTVPNGLRDKVLNVHDVVSGTTLDAEKLRDDRLKILPALLESGLVVELESKFKTMSGKEFYDVYFDKALDLWLDRAFSHPSWEAMMNGKEDKNVFIGWLFELFHYTKNANKHMPLAVAHCKHKYTKEQLSIHYKEEWNHYHFFRRSLEALGFSREEVENSDPLPMTDEMSNFMREAARTDYLAYAACSAVLEGTTVDNNTYDNFYGVVQKKYDIPQAAIQPIYDHLALDAKYGHSNLFKDICNSVNELTNERAELVMTYARLMGEHILSWSSNIASYYSNPGSAIPRVKPKYLDI